jgi:hypothetical protein
MKKTETEPGWKEKSIFLEGEVDLRCAYMEGEVRSLKKSVWGLIAVKRSNIYRWSNI